MTCDQVSQHHFSSGNLVFLLPVSLVTSLQHENTSVSTARMTDKHSPFDASLNLAQDVCTSHYFYEAGLLGTDCRLMGSHTGTEETTSFCLMPFPLL